MSHTSASVPPSLGAMGLYLLVCESRTARLPTLARTVPSRLVTWEMRPPSQTLVPTCLMALTRPSTIGVLSGFWEGNASTAPLARRRAAAVENSNKRVLLIPISFYSWAEEERTKPPPRYVRDGGNNTPSLRTDTSAGGSTSPGTLPHKQLPRLPSTRSSQNAGKTKFAFWAFSEVSLYGVLRSSTRAAVSLCHRPVFVWRTEVGELGEEVLVWSHLVLRHPPVRQDGEHVIAHIIGQQTTVVRVANRSRRVVGQDIR